MLNLPAHESESSIVKADAAAAIVKEDEEQSSYEELKKELEQEQKARKAAEDEVERLKEMIVENLLLSMRNEELVGENAELKESERKHLQTPTIAEEEDDDDDLGNLFLTERNEDLEEENATLIWRLKRSVRLLEAEEEYAVELESQVTGLKNQVLDNASLHSTSSSERGLKSKRRSSSKRDLLKGSKKKSSRDLKPGVKKSKKRSSSMNLEDGSLTSMLTQGLLERCFLLKEDENEACNILLQDDEDEACEPFGRLSQSDLSLSNSTLIELKPLESQSAQSGTLNE